jgi:hypothetical protein
MSRWFYQPNGRHDIHAPEAWDITTGDTSIVIGILDTGVLSWHPDLGGSTAGASGNMWTNWAEANGLPGVDDDGNGFIDDAHGWDFVDLATPTNIPAGEDWDEQDPDPSDFAGHGTVVAGLAGGIGNNGIGVTGTAWRVRIMPLRIGWAETSDPLGIVDMSYVAQAIRYATRMGAHVINCSFESIDMNGLFAAVDDAVRAGVIVVAAAGNGSPFHALADREDVIGVASTDSTDKISFFSNLGDYVDVAAPGEAIASTFVAHASTDSIGARFPTYIPSIDGTSMSSPLVAGGVALMLAHRKANNAPPAFPQEMLFRVRESADDLSAANPGVTGWGAGRLNLASAMTLARSSFARGPVAPIVGAPAVLASGTSYRAVVATLDRQLVIFDAQGNTVSVTPLPDVPVGGPAAADLGGGRGAGIFVACANGVLAGFDGFGTTLPGWPVSVAADGVVFVHGPALGDVDGDGVLDVVDNAPDGSVYVWNAGGTLVGPFPVAADGSGPSPVALSDLDGVPGVEILETTFGSRIFAFRNNATQPRVPGWPKTLPNQPSSPIVMRLGSNAQPSVVVAFGTSLRALGPNGATLFTATLPGSTFADPVAADVDGDGFDDIVVGVTAPDMLAVVDSSGTALAAHNWPRALTSNVSGQPIVVPGSGPRVYVAIGPRIAAFDADARAVHDFPRPGITGSAPTAWALDPTAVLRDRRTLGLVLYFYRAPAGTPDDVSAGWYTARGNFARTGSRLYAPAMATVDNTPARVADLAVQSVSDTIVTLRWGAVGDDGMIGRAAAYDVRAADAPIADSTAFANAPLRISLRATKDPGQTETLAFDGLAKSHTYWFALRAIDNVGLESGVSNTVSATTHSGGGGGPLAGVTGPAIACLAQPSRVPASLYWQSENAGATQNIRLFDLTGRRLRTLPLGGEASGVATWDGRDEDGRLLPAGIYFARLTSGSLHAQTRVVLLP